MRGAAALRSGATRSRRALRSIAGSLRTVPVLAFGEVRGPLVNWPLFTIYFMVKSDQSSHFGQRGSRRQARPPSVLPVRLVRQLEGQDARPLLDRERGVADEQLARVRRRRVLEHLRRLLQLLDRVERERDSGTRR